MNNIEKRNELVLQYMHLADRVAYLYEDSYVDYDERKAICYEGLIKCLTLKEDIDIKDMGSFLFVSIRNFLFSELQKSKAYKSNVPLEEDAALIPGIEDRCINIESLKQALEKLEPLERKIILLNYVGDTKGRRYTKEEIAEMLEISRSTVKRKSNAGLKVLRKEYGLSK